MSWSRCPETLHFQAFQAFWISEIPSQVALEQPVTVHGFVEDIGVGETMSRIKSYGSALVQLGKFGMGFKIYFWGYVVHTFLQVIPAGKSLPGSPSSLWENRFWTGALQFEHPHKKPLSPEPQTGYIALSPHCTSRFSVVWCSSAVHGVLNRTSGITTNWWVTLILGGFLSLETTFQRICGDSREGCWSQQLHWGWQKWKMST